MRMKSHFPSSRLLSMLWFMLLFPVSAHSQDTFSPDEFTISISQMEPQRWASRSVAYGYSLSIHNDSVSVDLPYMGVAHLPRLGETLPRFTAPVSAFSVRKGKKGRVEVGFRAAHADAWYTFRITARPDGRAHIHLSLSYAESIRYEGNWDNP